MNPIPFIIKITHQPPQLCRVIDTSLTLADGTTVATNQVLEWRGNLQIRYSADRDPMYLLHSEKSEAWLEYSHIEFLGRTPGCHTIDEVARVGLLGELLSSPPMIRALPSP